MPDIDFPLHLGQLEVVGSNSRITVNTAGQGGGKTTGGYWRTYGLMLAFPGESHFIGFPTYNLLNRVIINPVDPDRPTFVEFLTTMGEDPQLHIVDRWIKCKSGNILFASAENLQQWEGSHVKSAWIDEFDECPVGAYKRAMERTRMRVGYVLLTGTPRHVRWLKTEILPHIDEVIVDAEGKERNFITWVKFASTANPSYSPVQMEEAKRTLPDWEYRRLHLGELAEMEGGNLFHREWWNRCRVSLEDGNWMAEVVDN